MPIYVGSRSVRDMQWLDPTIGGAEAMSVRRVVYNGNVVWPEYRDQVFTRLSTSTKVDITVPSWARVMDIVAIGGGAGGSTGYREYQGSRPYGEGGKAARWVTRTVEVNPGAKIQWVVGEGGVGGSGFPAQDSINSGGAGTNTLVKVNNVEVLRARGGSGTSSLGSVGEAAPAVSAFGFSRSAVYHSGVPGDAGPHYGGGGAGGVSKSSPSPGGAGGNGYLRIRFRSY